MSKYRNILIGTNRMRTSLILLILLVSTSTKAQFLKLDSVSYTYPNDTLSIYVKISKNTTFTLWNTRIRESPNKLKLDICLYDGIGQAVTTEDTLIDFIPQQPIFDLEVNIFMDGFTTTCWDTVPILRKTFRNIVSIDDGYTLSQSKLHIFPNPATGNIRLNVSDAIKIEEIMLFNLAGKSIKNFDPTSRNLNVSEVPVGLYFLKVNTPERVLTQKVLIE